MPEVPLWREPTILSQRAKSANICTTKIMGELLRERQLKKGGATMCRGETTGVVRTLNSIDKSFSTILTPSGAAFSRALSSQAAERRQPGPAPAR